MTLKDTLKARITYRIKRNKSCVFIRKDFLDLSDTDQVGRVLRQLVQQGILIKLGYGVYARAKKSSINDKMILEKPLVDLAREILTKLGVKIVETPEQYLYNTGQSTQIPTGQKIAVQGRFNREISYNGQTLYFS